MKNVLLVDDDSIFQMLGKKTLNRLGVDNSNIRTAANGKQALEVFKAPGEPGELPEIILLDLNMPIMNGFEFLEAFNKLDDTLKQSPKIVIVTSSGDPDDMKRAMRLGAAEFLTKPLKDDELKSALMTAG